MSANQTPETVSTHDFSADPQLPFEVPPTQSDDTAESRSTLMSTGDPQRETMSVVDAARRLGISRATAYRQCRLYIDSGGRSGIPCLSVGGRLLVPVRLFYKMVFEGRLCRLSEADVTVPPPAGVRPVRPPDVALSASRLAADLIDGLPQDEEFELIRRGDSILLRRYRP